MRADVSPFEFEEHFVVFPIVHVGVASVSEERTSSDVVYSRICDRDGREVESRTSGRNPRGTAYQVLGADHPPAVDWWREETRTKPETSSRTPSLCPELGRNKGRAPDESWHVRAPVQRKWSQRYRFDVPAEDRARQAVSKGERTLQFRAGPTV